MINIPLDTGVTLVDDGVEVYAWIGDTEADPEHICWSSLVNDLIEAYTIPNHRGKTLLKGEDYDYLIEVLQGLQGAATFFHQRLNKAEIV